MVKWEYFTQETSRPVSMIDLDLRGQDGWELCSVIFHNSSWYRIFKRPTPGKEG